MPNQTLICSGCDEGTLTKIRYKNDFKHKNTLITVVNLEGHLCDTCDAEPITMPQARRNYCKITDAKRRYDGLLTSTEIKKIRKKLNLTQRQAAAVFGGAANAFTDYERGEVTQSEAMDKLLRLADTDPGVARRLLGQSGFDTQPQQRGDLQVRLR